MSRKLSWFGPLLLCAAALLLQSCVPPRQVRPNPYNVVRSVAVLPVYNLTNDVDGARKVRELASDRVANWHYSPTPIKEVDAALADSLGVTLGGQLEEIEPAKVGEALGVDALLYGYLLNFESVTTGVYNVKKARAAFKLVDAKSGKTIWSAGQGVKNVLTGGGNLALGAGVLKDVQEAREGLDEFSSLKALDSIPRLKRWHLISHVHLDKGMAEAGLISFGEKLVGKTVGLYMRFETDTMLNMIFDDFPPGPGPVAKARAASEPRPAVPGKLTPYPAAVRPLDPTGGPGFAVLGADRRDFTADISINISGAAVERNAVGTIERRGNMLRYDLAETVSRTGKDGEVDRRRTIVIHRGDELKNYVLYPETRRYVEYAPLPRAVLKPSIDRKAVGFDLVDGRRAERFRVDLIDAQGLRTGTVWASTVLDGFPVMTEFRDGAVVESMELRNVRFTRPALDRFRTPPDYFRADDPAELMPPTQDGPGGAAPVR